MEICTSPKKQTYYGLMARPVCSKAYFCQVAAVVSIASYQVHSAPMATCMWAVVLLAIVALCTDTTVEQELSLISLCLTAVAGCSIQWASCFMRRQPRYYPARPLSMACQIQA